MIRKSGLKNTYEFFFAGGWKNDLLGRRFSIINTVIFILQQFPVVVKLHFGAETPLNDDISQSFGDQILHVFRIPELLVGYPPSFPVGKIDRRGIVGVDTDQRIPAGDLVQVGFQL